MTRGVSSASIRFFTVVIVLLSTVLPTTDGVITSPRPRQLATALLRKLIPPSLPRPLFTPTETIAPAATASATPRLPWTESIDRNRELVYMPMLAKQLEVMAQLGMVEEPLPESFAYRTSTVKPARIGNVCFHNDRFRKVRLTYFDAGDSVQVFNALWYPKFEYDMPMLGIDLISLGKGRVLTVVDFQPLHPTADYHAKHIAPLTAIRNKYPDLQGTLSGKIYDDTSFFRYVCVLHGFRCFCGRNPSLPPLLFHVLFSPAKTCCLGGSPTSPSWSPSCGRLLTSTWTRTWRRWPLPSPTPGQTAWRRCGNGKPRTTRTAR